MGISVKHNIKNHGPLITNYTGENVLIYYNIIINNRKYLVYGLDIDEGWYRQSSRQWYCPWQIEVFKWNKGKLVKIAEDNFLPYKKRIHFHLSEKSTIEEHKQYILACIDFIDYWDISSYTIETKYTKELTVDFPNLFLSEFIMDDNCYVNYVIEKSNSEYNSYENFGVPSLKEEFLYFNFNHPNNPQDQSSYEFARSILFGPDYSKLHTFFPYEWTLKEPIVY